MATALQSESRRLQALRAEITAAERTLEGLQASIRQARSDSGMAHLEQVLAENERLMLQASRDTEEMDSAQAALDAAIKVSETDALTGLPNRLVLWDRLAHDIAIARRGNNFLTVYFLDLDGFKALNDAFGHAAGDRLLQVVATRLTQTLRACDTVCRIGGDEFVVVMQQTRTSDLQDMGRKLLQALEVPFLFEGHTHSASASLGASRYPLDGDTPESLVRQADAAMYRAKRQRKLGRPAEGSGGR